MLADYMTEKYTGTTRTLEEYLNEKKANGEYSRGYPTEANEYNEMKIQVLKYNGFYIGRYETGVNTTTMRTGVTTAQEVVCKKE